MVMMMIRSFGGDGEKEGKSGMSVKERREE